MPEVLTETERMQQLYDAACWAEQSSTEGRTFEEWCERVSDFGLDDAEQALSQYGMHLRDEVVEASKQAHIAEQAAYWGGNTITRTSALIEASEAGKRRFEAVQSLLDFESQNKE